MTVYVGINTPYNYKANFVVEGRAVTPTSATITLKNNTGAVVGGIEDEPLVIDTDATYSIFTVGASDNVPTLDYEIRTFTINFEYEGKDYVFNESYILRQIYFTAVTPDDVRALVGMSSDELPDASIDINGAYERVKAAVTGASLDNIFSSGSALISTARLAIMLAAALYGMKAFELSVMQSEQADNTLYKRFNSMDFTGIVDRLERDLAIAIATLNGVALGATDVVTVFQVATGTDPVTGS